MWFLKMMLLLTFLAVNIPRETNHTDEIYSSTSNNTYELESEEEEEQEEEEEPEELAA